MEPCEKDQCLCKRHPRELPCPFHDVRVHRAARRPLAVCDSVSELSPDTESTGALTLDLLAFRTV